MATILKLVPQEPPGARWVDLWAKAKAKGIAKGTLVKYLRRLESQRNIRYEDRRYFQTTRANMYAEHLKEVVAGRVERAHKTEIAGKTVADQQVLLRFLLRAFQRVFFDYVQMLNVLLEVHSATATSEIISLFMEALNDSYLTDLARDVWHNSRKTRTNRPGDVARMRDIRRNIRILDETTLALIPVQVFRAGSAE